MESQMDGHDELALLASPSALPNRSKRPSCRYYLSPKGKLPPNPLISYAVSLLPLGISSVFWRTLSPISPDLQSCPSLLDASHDFF